MGTRLVQGDETPEIEEMQGREPAVPAPPIVVPVDVVGPVRVQALPARSFAVRDMALANAADPQRLLGQDLLRSRVVIAWSGGDLVIAPSFEEAGANRGRLAVGSSPITFQHTEEVWVRAPAADVTVTAHIEQWAV